MNTFDFTQFPIIETKRLILRRITKDDAHSWLAVYNQPDVMKYLIDFDEAQTDLNEINDIIAWCDDIFVGKSGIRWAITLKPNNVMIGSCWFHIYSPHNRQAEIGYELIPAYQGKGLMSEAVEAVIKFGFETLSLRSIEAEVAPRNEASIKLLEKYSFNRIHLENDETEVIRYSLKKMR